MEESVDVERADVDEGVGMRVLGLAEAGEAEVIEVEFGEMKRDEWECGARTDI